MRKVFSILLLISLMFIVTGCNSETSYNEADNVKLIKKVANPNNSDYFLVVQKNSEVFQFKTSREIYQSVSDGNIINVLYDNNTFDAVKVTPIQFSGGHDMQDNQQ